MRVAVVIVFLFQAEDGIRDLVRSRGLGDVYKRQVRRAAARSNGPMTVPKASPYTMATCTPARTAMSICLLYTSDAADERSSVDLGGRRIIKKKTHNRLGPGRVSYQSISKATHTRTSRRTYNAKSNISSNY